MRTLHKDIGDRIAILRHENNITQAQLAEKLDISIKHCSEVERGVSCLSLEKLVGLCSILSTDLDYLVRGIDKRSPSETAIPFFIIDVFNSDDTRQQDLLKEYILLFKKFTENQTEDN